MGTIREDDRLWFDTNVALKGIAAEQPKPETPIGKVKSRKDFHNLFNHARADVVDMDEERERRKSIQ